MTTSEQTTIAEICDRMSRQLPEDITYATALSACGTLAAHLIFDHAQRSGVDPKQAADHFCRQIQEIIAEKPPGRRRERLS
jgi:hypothetical protein